MIALTIEKLSVQLTTPSTDVLNGNEPQSQVTSIDGTLVSSPISLSKSSTASSPSLDDKPKNEYILMFNGTSSGPDAAINGIGYLTYTILPDEPYNVEKCWEFCDSVEGCGEFPFSLLCSSSSSSSSS